MAAITVTGIDHVVLRVVDADTMVEFYCNALGCEVEKVQEEYGLIQLRAGDALIDLLLVDGKLGRLGGAAPGKEGRNLDHFCLRLEHFEPDAIKSMLQRVGIETSPVAQRYGAGGFGLSLYIEDPEGNVIELRGSSSAAARATQTPAG